MRSPYDLSLVRTFVASLLSEVVEHLRRDTWIYVCVAGYSFVCLAILLMTGHWEQSSHANYFVQWPLLFLYFFPMMAIAVDLAYAIIRFGRGRARAYRHFFGRRRLARMLSGMSLLMALMIFQGSFTSIKNMLPILAGGFRYDRLHADIDRIIHLGNDPWLLLFRIADNRWILSVAEWNYSVLWFALCFACLFFVATSPRADAIRGRYIFMFMFVWVVCGNVLAGLFLSAGPVYYGAVTGDEARFSALAAFLANGQAHEFQQYLWTLYEKGVAGFGSGISAFPSVHVGLITMNALFLAERGRWWAAAGAAYVLLIMASSVYLGWHYAIDGYVSAGLTTAAHHLLKAVSAKRRGRVGSVALASPVLHSPT
ncbi:hypothetical protein ACO34A_14505 [Rhizobium sp. ACO-34A]|nr:hypothetical protein ACO34A_14505 [Rhizobium sp. ACO-34A]